MVWGSGKPRREFLHVDDLADACLFLVGKLRRRDAFNVGTGEDLTIGDLRRFGPRRRLPRCRNRVRFQHARRHAAKTARRVTVARPRLAAPDLLDGRDCLGVRMVLWPPGRSPATSHGLIDPPAQSAGTVHQFRNSHANAPERNEPMPTASEKRKIALVTGITGQDGSYLAELLLKKVRGAGA